jgi:hypothetical protein
MIFKGILWRTNIRQPLARENGAAVLLRCSAM